MGIADRIVRRTEVFHPNPKGGLVRLGLEVAFFLSLSPVTYRHRSPAPAQASEPLSQRKKMEGSKNIWLPRYPISV